MSPGLIFRSGVSFGGNNRVGVCGLTLGSSIIDHCGLILF